MPLKANLKKKTEQEKEQSYTKPKNNASLPKKTVTTAKQSAQAIKSSVGGKKTSPKKSSISSSGYVRQSPKLNTVKKQQAQKKWDTEKGSYKTDSKNNIGRTGSNTKKKSPKQWVSELNESTNKDTYTFKGLSYDKVSSRKQGGHQSNQLAEKSNKNLQRNERHQAYADPQFREISQEAASSYAIPKFFGNLAEGTINYSIPGIIATGLAGSAPSEWDVFKPHNYTKADEMRNDQYHSGTSALAGQLVGGALGFNAGRALEYMKYYDQLADTVINSTKVGSLIKNSSVAGKIGTKLGKEAVDSFIRNGVSEGLRDLTMGVGENALISYGEGNRGMDWLKDLGLQTAADLTLGSSVEGIGVGSKMRGVNKLLNRKPSDLMKGVNNKDAYMRRLLEEAEANLGRMDIEGISNEVRNAHLNKAAELMSELKAVREMDDVAFDSYFKTREMPDVPKDAKVDTPTAKSDNKPETKGEPKTEAKEPKAETKAPQKTYKDLNMVNSKDVGAKIGRKGSAQGKYEFGDRGLVKKGEKSYTLSTDEKGNVTKVEKNLKNVEEPKAKATEPEPTPKAKETVKTVEPEVKAEVKVEEPKVEKPVESATPSKAEVKSDIAESAEPIKATPPKEVKAEEPKVEAKVEEVKPTTKVEELPKKTEKAEVKPELPKAKEEKVKILKRDSRDTIIEKMRTAGTLPEKYEKLTKAELTDIHNGVKTAEQVSEKAVERVSKKSIDINKYLDTYGVGSETAQKTKMLDDYISDKKAIGESLSDAEVKKLQALDSDSLYEHIEADVLEKAKKRFGRDFEDIDEYLDFMDDESDLIMKTSGGSGTYTLSGYTNTTDVVTNTGRRKVKRLPKDPTLQQTRKYSSLNESINIESPKGKGKPKLEQVSDLKPEESIRNVTTDVTQAKTKEKKSLWNKFREGLRTADRQIFNKQQAIARMDKKVKGRELRDKAVAITTAKDRANYVFNEELLGRNGQKIGNGVAFNKTLKKVEDHMDEFTQLWMLRHNKYRALQQSSELGTKDIWGFDGETAKRMADSLETSFPALKDKRDDLIKWLAGNGQSGGMRKDKTFKKLEKYYGKKNFKKVTEAIRKYLSDESEKAANELAKKFEKEYDIKDVDGIIKELNDNWRAFRNEYGVETGLISKEAVEKMDEMYPEYFPVIRAYDSVKGANRLDTPDVVKAIKGSSGVAALNANDALAIMVHRFVKAGSQNELSLAVIKNIQDNAELKGFGEVINKGKKMEDLDEAIDTISQAVEETSKGSRKLTALQNGERITIKMSDELGATMEALYYARETGIAERLGRAITNPVKSLTTQNNPLFAIPNLIRDLATYTVQSEHGLVSRTTGLAKAMKGMTEYAVGANTKAANTYKLYKFGTGNTKELLAETKLAEKSILPSKALSDTRKKIGKITNMFSAINGSTETLFRYAEFVNTYKKTGGDLNQAVRDARKVTVDFTQRGSSEFVQAIDGWVMYTNAGLQGIRQMAETLRSHPFRTTGRMLAYIAAPYAALQIWNDDNPHYHELTDRTRQMYYCIPNLGGEKDENGNCKTFIKLPMTKEYGVILSSAMDCLYRYANGEEDWKSGYLNSIKEGVLPNNPVTDSILAPLMINLPMNTDYKGDKILTSSEQNAMKNGGKYLDKQYDSKTSKPAMMVSEFANQVMGDKDIPYLKYLKSPKAVDYLMGSYLGGVGSVLKSINGNNAGTTEDKIVDNVKNVVGNKFVADSRYSSDTLAKTFDKYDEYKIASDNEDVDDNEWSEAKAAYYNGAKPLMDAVYDSIEKEKEIKADTTFTSAEKKEMINDLREARIELAKTLESEAKKAAKEYRESPTYSSLSESQREKWTDDLGIKKEKWAIAYNEKLKAEREKKEKTGKSLTNEEKVYLLQENGITTYKQAKSIDGSIGSTFYIDDEKGEKLWQEAKDSSKSFSEIQQETIDKYERQKNMTESEINFDNYSRDRAETRYANTSRKVIDQKTYDAGIYELQYVDKHTDNNGSITQAEAQNAIENLDQMYGLTQEQKAYFWYLFQPEKGWKKQPYGKWNG